MKTSPTQGAQRLAGRCGEPGGEEDSLLCSFSFCSENWVEGNQVEVIFVSSDRSEAAQMDYMKEAHG